MRWVGLFIAMALVPGCGPRPRSCRTSADCPESATCERYFCTATDNTDTYDGGLPLISDLDGGEEPFDAGDEDAGDPPVDAGEEPFDAGDEDAGPNAMTCVSHTECKAPLKCRGHVCR